MHRQPAYLNLNICYNKSKHRKVATEIHGNECLHHFVPLVGGTNQSKYSIEFLFVEYALTQLPH